ncbi:MAG: riboflavin synthase [Candidatus Rokubacteria bacterium]|nr:riboflavin synthase [Candidatus Rokubacteria bacterium]
MFTGIVEELGEVALLAPRGTAWRLTVKAARVLEGSELGASLAVNGVCLTVVERGGGWLGFDLAPETLKVSALGNLAPGDAVNLERPARLGAPLGGHLVLGHVDGVGTVAAAAREGETLRMRITLPDRGLARYLIPRGSVAVDGVSLTIAGLAPEAFEVMVIPHTLAVTTLGKRGPGARVNLEMDLIGKYLFRFFETSGQPWPGGAA